MLTEVETTKADAKLGVRVWGVFDGEVFDRTWPSGSAWSAWRRLNERRYTIEVRGMVSEARP